MASARYEIELPSIVTPAVLPVSIVAPAIVVGWKVSGPYKALSYEVNSQWDFDSSALREGATADLRQALAADAKLRVLIVHGWNDLSCPFMASILTADQLPAMGDASRVSVRMYPGGHMFYSRPDSVAALRKDVQELFAKR